jgi:hypothetical protein
MHVGARESSTTSAAHTGHDNPSDSLARSATAPEPELMDSSSSLHWHKEQDREGLLRAGQEAAAGLTDVARVLDDIEIDLTFARHADRMQLRQSSERLGSIARTLVGETQASSPIGARHASILGKVALAAATMSMLPFAEGAGPLAGRKFRASYEHAMRNLERVHQYAEAAQSETRMDLRLQITALFSRLDGLAAEVGVEIGDRLDLGQATNTPQLPPSAALDGLREAIEMAPSDTTQAPHGEMQDATVGTISGLAETLAVIEYRIAEVFAQLTGDAPL